jgi:hypothetical protein
MDTVLGILVKYEIHAFVLLIVGCGMYLHGVHDQGQVIIGAALLVFKGQK